MQAQAFAAAQVVMAFAAEEGTAFVGGEQAPAFAAAERAKGCVVVVRVWDLPEHAEYARTPVGYYGARSSPAGDSEQPAVCFPDDLFQPADVVLSVVKAPEWDGGWLQVPHVCYPG